MAVLFMNPTLVTRPVNAMGGFVAAVYNDDEGEERETDGPPPGHPRNGAPARAD